jgi:hypothetical protein
MPIRNTSAKPSLKSSRTRRSGQDLLTVRPGEEALRHLGDGTRRTKGRATQVRRSFVNSVFAGTEVPPLAMIVRSGRAGGLRLRLLLSLLWMGGGGDARHSVTFPARAWAEMLDLSYPENAGERRVRAALAWLEQKRLVQVDRQPGRIPTVTLRREDGSGENYTQPVKGRKDRSTGKLNQRDWNFTLPSEFWTNAWILALSLPALAVLLVLLDMQRKDDEPQWIAPAEARKRYVVSEDTWTRGVAELDAQGIVTVIKEPVSATFGWRRVRNKYVVNRQRLHGDPLWEE